jgi:hypothetical protein
VDMPLAMGVEALNGQGAIKIGGEAQKNHRMLRLIFMQYSKV